MRFVRPLAWCVFLAAVPVLADAQQSPSQAPATAPASTSPAPVPAAPTVQWTGAGREGTSSPNDVTLLGTSLLFFRQQLQKTPSGFVIPRGNPVATFRVTITPDYRAEFTSKFGPMWALSEEEKKLTRMNAKGGGLDPMVAVRAYKRIAKSYERRQARKEVESVLEEFRRQARRLAAIEEAAAKEAAAKEAEKKGDVVKNPEK